MPYNNFSRRKHLLGLGADTERELSDSDTPLWEAIGANDHICIEFVLSRDANYLRKNSGAETVLHQAVMKGDGQNPGSGRFGES